MRPERTVQTCEPFDVLIGRSAASEYPVTVTRAPAGDAQGICQLDLEGPDFRADLLHLENGDTGGGLLIAFGRHLFDALFAGEITSLFRSSLGQVRGQGKGLRVRLLLEPPELAALSWEYLYDAGEDRFLAISPETPLVRYVPMQGASRPTPVTPPLRVLVVLSSPRDAPALDVMQERDIIQEALREGVVQGFTQLHVLEHGLVPEISQAMRDFHPHVFHFIGHGQFEGEGAWMLLEDEDGYALPVDERAFREFFLGMPDTRVAVLNACQTASLSATRPLVGLAPRILQRNLSAVIAMQYPMPDRAALIFSREFYRSLASGYPVDAAVAEARKGIFLEVGGDVRDWGIPVLFLRAADGWLFEMAGASASAGAHPPQERTPLEPATPTPRRVAPASGQNQFQVGDIQAGIVNVGGTQTFAGDLSFNLDFSQTAPPTGAGARGVSGDPGGTAGDFREAALDIQLRLERVMQRIQALANVEGETRDTLAWLTAQLSQLLPPVPPGRIDAADRVCRRVEALIKEIGQTEPDLEMVEIIGESLKRAAQGLADVVPDVLTVATQMAAQAKRVSENR